ncbi:MAG: adenylyl-sulfate kinase [Xanthobacteraceae bacterium]
MRAPQSCAGDDRTQLRFFTCGSVDDGKSTLIGRLLQDTGSISEDQLEALKRDSARFGTTGGELDFALLVDGLEDEREQGITIDVAYRYFSTPRRAFVVADTPGHVQYTRNMATGASGAELAVLLVDARKGLLPQTRRHAAIASLMGIRHAVLAVNKFDLVGWDRAVFEEIVNAFATFARQLGFEEVVPIPVCALQGDNLTKHSENTPWYQGPTLIEHLETVEIESNAADKPARLPVQTILRPDADTRLYAGTLVSGSLAIGDPVVASSSGRMSAVAAIFVSGEARTNAVADDAVAIALADQIDVARGEVIAPARARPRCADQFAAHLVWMSENPLLPGRSLLLRIGARTVPASVTGIKYRLAVETLEHQPARTLELNDIGVCNIATAAPIAFDLFSENRNTGGFLLIDRYSNATIAAGTIDFALRRGENVHFHELDVSKRTRATLMGQRPCIVWFTGLSGAGKSTIANRLELKLSGGGRHTYLLDGDNVRSGLNKDLGFTAADRVENIRRVGEVAKLFLDAGIIVLCAFISPFREERAAVRGLVGEGEFLEVFVDTPLHLCEARDPKGLYAKSRLGQLPNFTGIDSPYERPERPDLVLETAKADPDMLADRVIDFLASGGYFNPPAASS